MVTIDTPTDWLDPAQQRAWRAFIDAVRQVSIRDYIERTDHEPLKDLFNLVLDAYAGDKGYLGVHRLKAYGFLEVAFKAGRSVTIGGFKGLFQDRTWNQIDAENAGGLTSSATTPADTESSLPSNESASPNRP